jgi:hypothetical protein
MGTRAFRENLEISIVTSADSGSVDRRTLLSISEAFKPKLGGVK